MKIFFALLAGLLCVELQAGTFDVVLVPLNETVLSSRVASIVATRPKGMGSSFENGELLLSLDETIFAARHERAKSFFGKARAQLDAKQSLFRDDVASRLELKEAEASLADAKLELVTAERELEACQIIAPYQGHVVDVPVGIHESVAIGEPLIEIVNDRHLHAQFFVSSDLLPALSIGMPFEVQVKETGKSVLAKLSNISAVIDPLSSLVKVYGRVDNAKSLLKAGMIGTTSIEFSQGEE